MALVLNNFKEAKKDVRNLQNQLEIAQKNVDSMEKLLQVAMIESMGNLGITGKFIFF